MLTKYVSFYLLKIGFWSHQKAKQSNLGDYFSES